MRSGQHNHEVKQVIRAQREVKLLSKGRSRLDRWELERRRPGLEALEAAALRRSRRDEWLERLDARLRGVDAVPDHGHPPPVSFDYVDVPRSG